MKANILALVIIAVIFGLAVSGALGQTQYVPAVNLITEKEGIGGEHAPLVWTGAGQPTGAATPYVTAWMQIGSDYLSTNLENRVSTIYNPENFTLTVRCRKAVGLLDRLQIARFEYGVGDTASVDTTSTKQIFWNADSSNLFIADGNFNHTQYGTWRFEDLNDTLITYVYPLRVLRGPYIRLIFGSADTLRVEWTLTCEN